MTTQATAAATPKAGEAHGTEPPAPSPWKLARWKRYQQKLAAIDELKKSLLREAFAGRL